MVLIFSVTIVQKMIVLCFTNQFQINKQLVLVCFGVKALLGLGKNISQFQHEDPQHYFGSFLVSYVIGCSSVTG